MKNFNRFKRHDSNSYPPPHINVLVIYKGKNGLLKYGIDMVTQLFTTTPKFTSINEDYIIGWWELPTLPDDHVQEK